jgi:serine protease AprX
MRTDPSFRSSISSPLRPSPDPPPNSHHPSLTHRVLAIMKQSSRLRFRPFLALLLVVLALGSASSAMAGGIAPDLAHLLRARPNATEPVQVIVQFTRSGMDAGALASACGGQVLEDEPLIGGAALEVQLRSLTWLKKQPGVGWISPDRTVGATWDYSIQTLGADQVWATTGLKGTGICVAVLDTGVDPVDDLDRTRGNKSRVVGWMDFVKGKKKPYDDNGHGTHVAGIVAGNGKDSTGLFSGVAPEADLVAVKVLDKDGAGSVSTVIAGIDWCIQNKAVYNLRVMNLSFGHDPAESAATDPLCAAVRRAVAAGIVVVVSAGNKGKDAQGNTVYGGISCPGNEPCAITVGALNTEGTPTRADDTVTTFSSRGPTFIDGTVKPDVVAPGNRIVSLRVPGGLLDKTFPGTRVPPGKSGGNTWNDAYTTLSGTSMAAPMVAGMAALILQANPNLDPNTVKSILMYTAQQLDLRDAGGQPLPLGLSVLTQGAGSVNLAGAVEVASKIDASKVVGSPWLTAGLSGQTTLSNFTFNWSGGLLYGGQVIWGQGIFAVRQELFDIDVPWGDQVVWGQQITWGADGVEAAQPIWGDQVIWGLVDLWGDPDSWGEISVRILTEGE